MKRLVQTYQRMAQRRRCRSSAVTGHHRRTRTHPHELFAAALFECEYGAIVCVRAALCVCVLHARYGLTAMFGVYPQFRRRQHRHRRTTRACRRVAVVALQYRQYSIASDGIPLHYVFRGGVGSKSEHHGGRKVTKYVGLYVPKYDSFSNYIYELIQI